MSFHIQRDIKDLPLFDCCNWCDNGELEIGYSGGKDREFYLWCSHTKSSEENVFIILLSGQCKFYSPLVEAYTAGDFKLEGE